MANNSKRMRASSRRTPTGTFDTPGGRTYLENLRRILPDAEVDKIVEQVQADDARRSQAKQRSK